MSPKSFESMVQDLVYNVDMGGGFRIIKVVLYILLLLTIMLIYSASQFDSFTEAEAMEYAQLGRNLARTGTLTTQVVRPGTMAYLMDHTGEGDPRVMGHPDILHPPVYPALLATIFKLSGVSFETDMESITHAPEIWIVLPLCHLFTVLTGVLIWLLGRRLFDNRVGLLAMTVFFLSDSVWRTSISGLNLSLAAFLSLGAFYFALVTTDRAAEEASSPLRRYAPFAGAAIFCILAFLTRYSAFVIVPGIALYLALAIRPRGWAWAAALLVIFVVGISPWMIRNKVVAGSAFGFAPRTALAETRLYPADQIDRAFSPGAAEKGLGATVKSLQIKWLGHVKEYYNLDIRTIGEGFFICIFLVTYLYRFARKRTGLYRWGIGLSILLLLALAGLFGDSTIRTLHVFLPFVLIYGIAFFFILLDRMQFSYTLQRAAVTTILVLLAVAPLVITLMPPRKGYPYPPYLAPYPAFVSGLLETNELMCTDMPWATAWYGDRTSLLLPATLDGFYRINDDHVTIDALYFTLLTRDKPFVSGITREEGSWAPLFMGNVPRGFPLTEGMPIAGQDQLFITRGSIMKRAGNR